MMYTFLFLMALAEFANVEPCGIRPDGNLCRSPQPGSQYLLASSNMRQVKCGPEAQTQDATVFHMAYAKKGVRYNCAEIKKSDSEFDAKFEYPNKPDSKGALSYAHMESNEQIINCYQSSDEMDQVVFSPADGFFPVIDLKNGINYMCSQSNKQRQSLADRVARAFSSSCLDDVDLEE